MTLRRQFVHSCYHIIDHNTDTNQNAVYIQINHFIQIMLYIEIFLTPLSSSKSQWFPSTFKTVSNNIDITRKSWCKCCSVTTTTSSVTCVAS